MWEIRLHLSQPFYGFVLYPLGTARHSTLHILVIQAQTRILSDHWSSTRQRSARPPVFSTETEVYIHRSRKLVYPGKAYMISGARLSSMGQWYRLPHSTVRVSDSVTGLPSPRSPGTGTMERGMAMVPQIPTPRSQYNESGKGTPPPSHDQDNFQGAIEFRETGKESGQRRRPGDPRSAHPDVRIRVPWTRFVWLVHLTDHHRNGIHEA